MATRSKTQAAPAATPEPTPLPPQTTPPGSGGGGDYSPYVWKQLADIQQSMGRLESTLAQSLRNQEKVEAKVDKLEDKLSGVTHKIYGATAILTLLVAIGGFIVHKAWDLMVSNLVQRPSVSSQAPQPSQGTLPPGPASQATRP
jgi:hypothetical protein